MFFKISSSFLTLFFVLSVLLGCNNGHDFEDKETVVSLDYETECLDEIGTHFELYFDGLLAESKLSESFRCIQEGISYFQNKVKQEETGFYSLKEIRNLFNRFLTKRKFSNLFYENIFLFKSQFFGGSKELISDFDLEVFKVFVKDLETIMFDLMPFADLLAFGEGELSKEDLAFSTQKIKSFLDKWFAYNESNLSEKVIVDILIEASDSKDSAFKIAGDSWFKVFDLLRKAERKSVILHVEKPKAVSKIIEVLETAVNLNGALSYEWLDTRENYLGLEKEIDNGIIFISNSLGLSKWSEPDLMDIFKVIEALELLPEKIKGDVRSELIRLIFDTYFPDDLKDGKGELSAKNLNLIKAEWSFFKEFVLKTKQLEGFIGTKFPLVLSGEEPFERLTRAAWPVLVDKQSDTLFLTDKTEDVDFSFRSLFHISWQMVAAKLLIKTYALDPVRANELVGLELLEVKTAYYDIFEILLATDILDENSRKGWFRIFNEINLFVPSASPDNYAGLVEATEYLAYLYSGINAGDDISDKIESWCPSYDKECVENAFYLSSKELFITMPTLSEYFTLEQPSEKSLKEWFDSFEFIAKLENDDSPYSSSLIFRGTIANQYVETIFKRFDVDKNDKIDFQDSEFAYGTFKEALKLLPQVKGTVAENDDEFLYAFFSFFIKEGRLPKFRNGIPRREFSVWKTNVKRCQNDWEKWGERKCGFKVDRSRILALLAFLTGVELVEEDE